MLRSSKRKTCLRNSYSGVLGLLLLCPSCGPAELCTQPWPGIQLPGSCEPGPQTSSYELSPLFTYSVLSKNSEHKPSRGVKAKGDQSPVLAGGLLSKYIYFPSPTAHPQVSSLSLPALASLLQDPARVEKVRHPLPRKLRLEPSVSGGTHASPLP